jgi:hypothetical protein
MAGLAMSGTGSSTILPAVEQRIGTSSQPLNGAGVDPAFIPGLISPASDAEPEDAEPVAADPEKAGTARKPVFEAAPSPVGDADDEPEPSPEEESVPDGPAFEASDRRARIVADGNGVRLRLDDQECEFGWDEIGAVETETSRFGKRFTVTVHTPDRRWYPIEIQADSRSRFQEWEARLDEVLDAYFEDGGEETATPGQDDDD